MLMLVGVEPYHKEQMARTGLLRVVGRENFILVDERVGQALQDALDAAEQWIAAQPGASARRQVQNGRSGSLALR